jgi:serine/threonine-protein kinase
MTDPLRDRVTAVVGNRYQIESEIGRGGMGVVYRATDTRLRRRVAIKVLPPELAFRDDIRSRFLREAQTAAQLSHASIVPIYEVDEREGLVYFVMALVEGESLASRLRREPRPPVDFVVHVLRDVADALISAHTAGIIHRDIKPDNILIEAGSDRPVVTDFGIARAAEGDSRLTLTGIAVGTPAYMSPEQAIGEREIDGRSDIYSLAIVGYQMLAGEAPFSASNTPAMLMKHIGEVPQPLDQRRRDLPVALVRAIERGMAKKAVERWPNAAAFRDALTRPDAGPALDRMAQRSSGVPDSNGHLRPRDADRDAAARAPRPPSVHDAVRRPNPPPPTLPPALLSLGSRGGRERLEPPRAPWRTPTSPSDAPIPQWMPATWRDARRQWKAEYRAGRDQWRDDRRRAKDAWRQAKAAEQTSPQAVEHRILAFRRKAVGTVIGVGTLAVINAVTSPMVPWFLIPGAFMTLGLLHRAGSLWAEGIRIRDVFGRGARLKAPPGSSPAALRPPIEQLAAALAPRDVVEGPFGETVRRAAEDRATAHEVIEKLGKADREMIPDVIPTVDALAERIGSLAQALHRIDGDIPPNALADIDVRIAAAEREPETVADRDRRIALLTRQRQTIDDLLGRRSTLAGQLESASLMLQNMKLDLLALRSVGVQSAMDDVSNATQEARALSREIGHVLDAAREVRRT